MKATTSAQHIYNIAELTPHYSTNVKSSDKLTVTGSPDSAKIIRDLIGGVIEWKEEFFVLCLNRANKVLCYTRVSSGGIAGTVADPKIIFQIALLANASAIIISHNHPSGNLKPSVQDDLLTKQLADGGKLLDINVLDHIIITAEGYYSYSDEGRI